MSSDVTVERFFDVLISGDRPTARALVAKLVSSGWGGERLIHELFWPTYEMVDRLFRADQLTAVAHHLATRLLRVLVDQNAARLTQKPPRERTIFAVCGPGEADELGAQMAVDLLESSGFSIVFCGGGIANDEILAQVNQRNPDVLLAFATAPADLPSLRQLIDTLGTIGACPKLQIAVGGGVFNRADGLAEEIGADLWADSPLEMVEMLIDQPERRAAVDQRTVGKNRRKRVA